jgi:hypothetical protein
LHLARQRRARPSGSHGSSRAIRACSAPRDACGIFRYSTWQPSRPRLWARQMRRRAQRLEPSLRHFHCMPFGGSIPRPWISAPRSRRVRRGGIRPRRGGIRPAHRCCGAGRRGRRASWPPPCLDERLGAGYRFETGGKPQRVSGDLRAFGDLGHWQCLGSLAFWWGARSGARLGAWCTQRPGRMCAYRVRIIPGRELTGR